MPENSKSTNNGAIGRILDALGIENDELSFWEQLSIWGFIIGTLAVAIFTFSLDYSYAARFGILFSVGIGAWMSGGGLGFLFGVPRYQSPSDAPQHLGPLSTSVQRAIAFTPNTNLEQISDWLTKIIVGATLVDLQTIAREFGRLCAWIGGNINQSGADIFAGGIMVFFFCCGFLWGYLWCSIRIFGLLVKMTATLREDRGEGIGLSFVRPLGARPPQAPSPQA